MGWREPRVTKSGRTKLEKKRRQGQQGSFMESLHRRTKRAAGPKRKRASAWEGGRGREQDEKQVPGRPRP